MTGTYHSGLSHGVPEFSIGGEHASFQVALATPYDETSQKAFIINTKFIT